MWDTENLVAVDGIKPASPVWPGRKVKNSRTDDERRKKPQDHEKQDERKDNDTDPHIDEYV